MRSASGLVVSVVAIALATPGCSSPRGELPAADGATAVAIPDAGTNSPPAAEAGAAPGQGGSGGDASPGTADGAVSPAPDAGTREVAPAAPGRATLSLGFVGLGKGLLRPEPGPAVCTTECMLDYQLGQTVVVTAVPIPPALFVGFSGACMGVGPCSVKLDASAVVTAHFDLPGTPAWELPLPNGNIIGLAERDGRVYAVGSADTEFDGTPVVKGQRDIFVARHDLATGNRAWIRRIRSLVEETVTGGQAVGLDREGQLVLSGTQSNAADFGGVTLNPAPANLFTARYNADTGALLGVRNTFGGGWIAGNGMELVIGNRNEYWHFRGLEDLIHNPAAVVPIATMGGALSAGRDVVLGGYFVNELRLGALVLRHAEPAIDAAWVAKLDAASRPVWAVKIAGAGNCMTSAMAIDQAGDVIAVGAYERDATLENTTFRNQGYVDAFIVKLSGQDGKLRWSQVLTGVERQFGDGVAILPNGDVYAAIEATGKSTFNATTLEPPGFLVKLAGADGRPLWSRQLSDSPRSFLLASNGHLLVGGWSSLVKIIP